MHLHIFSKNKNRNASAKVWLVTLHVFDRGQLTKEEINIAVKLIQKNKEKINTQIEAFRKGKKLKPITLK